MKKRILALDLGSRAGWAVGLPGADGLTAVESGVFYNTASPDEHFGARFVRFSSWLKNAFEKYRPDEVRFEEVEFLVQGMDQPRIYFGLRGLLLAHCSQRNVPCVPVSVAEIKMLATGSGAAKKPQMVAAARKHFPGQRIHDDNQADALNLLRHGMMAAAGTLRASLDISREAAKKTSAERSRLRAKAKRASA